MAAGIHRQILTIIVVMTHTRLRGLFLLLTLVLLTLTASYFDAYKIGGPQILRPFSFINTGSVLLLAGSIIVFDTFFYFQDGIKKIKKPTLDVPFGYSLVCIFFGAYTLLSGIVTIMTGNYLR